MLRLPSRKAMLDTLVRRRGLVRLSLVPLALLALLGGCTGLIGTGEGPDDEGLTPEEQAARELFITKAAPVLKTSCIACHGVMAPTFLAGTTDLEIRDTLLAYEPVVVNLDAPQSSRLLTKGPHSGPGLTAAELGEVLEWIRAEKDAQPDPGPSEIPLETQPFTVQPCVSGTAPSATCPINTVDLTPLGVAGAKIEFVAPVVGTSLYINQLKLTAGAEGVFIEHPLFVSHPTGAEPIPDTIDRYYATTMNLMATVTEQIEGGTASFGGFAPTDPVTIHFKTVKIYQPDTMTPVGGGGGCKVLDSFKTNARAGFQNSCASCHANANDLNATGAMNITGINSADDMMVQRACNQVLTRVNLIDPDQSGVFLAPTPGNNNHPFRFADINALNAFKTPALIWINAEKTAP